jgi:hypothetical protein
VTRHSPKWPLGSGKGQRRFSFGKTKFMLPYKLSLRLPDGVGRASGLLRRSSKDKEK